MEPSELAGTAEQVEEISSIEQVKESSSRVLLVAGGTGGHVFPAQALAEHWVSRGYEVTLWVDERGLTYFPDKVAKDLSKDHFSWKGASLVVFRSPVTSSRLKVQMALKEAGQVYQAFQAYKKIMKQEMFHFVWGMGGSFTVLPLLAARFLDIPFGIFQPDATIGKANNLLSLFSHVTALGAKESGSTLWAGKKKAVLTGTPVRHAFQKAGGMYQQGQPTERSEWLKKYFAWEKEEEEGLFNLAVVGGSQGATKFSKIVPQGLALLSPEDRGRVRVFHQCPQKDKEALVKLYKNLGVSAVVAPFVLPLWEVLSGCHAVFARGGGSMMAELAVMGIPGLFVPYPFGDGHQIRNCDRVQEVDGGWVILEEDLSPEDVAKFIKDGLDNPHQWQEKSKNIRTLNCPQACERVTAAMERILVV